MKSLNIKRIAETKMQELIDDGMDFLDGGVSLKLTLEILKESTTIGLGYWVRVVSELTAYYYRPIKVEMQSI